LENAELYWSRTKRLMVISMVIWAIFSFGIHLFAKPLNEVVILGFPLGFYMAAQGSLVIFVILIFWFARQQDAIDRECGVAEED
jgi:putative solute:sodium symporter small subunit